jgi:orotidine-5'-phosphate decarboxylase
MSALGKLLAIQAKNQSRLCIGLDTDKSKIPAHLQGLDHPVQPYNSAIIRATQASACAFKLNTAFYEQYGLEGWQALKDTLNAIPGDIFTIADAKRADIGNTSAAYAKAVFEDLNCDAITVNPYMGYDSLAPFLEWTGKMVIILALTSNPGSADFQRLECNGKPLYQHVVEKVLSWKSNADIGFVIGATHPDELALLRKLAPDSTFLIPGVGAQGGDIQAIRQANGSGPVMVNVSRGIQYAGNSINFEEKAREAAEFYRGAIGMEAPA